MKRLTLKNNNMRCVIDANATTCGKCVYKGVNYCKLFNKRTVGDSRVSGCLQAEIRTKRQTLKRERKKLMR